MMFEEEFPSLRKYLHPVNHTVHAQQIMENCLDKQRVREALKKVDAEIVGTMSQNKYKPYQVINMIWKELGL